MDVCVCVCVRVQQHSLYESLPSRHAHRVPHDIDVCHVAERAKQLLELVLADVRVQVQDLFTHTHTDVCTHAHTRG